MPPQQVEFELKRHFNAAFEVKGERSFTMALLQLQLDLAIFQEHIKQDSPPNVHRELRDHATALMAALTHANLSSEYLSLSDKIASVYRANLYSGPQRLQTAFARSIPSFLTSLAGRESRIKQRRFASITTKHAAGFFEEDLHKVLCALSDLQNQLDAEKIAAFMVKYTQQQIAKRLEIFELPYRERNILSPILYINDIYSTLKRKETSNKIFQLFDFQLSKQLPQFIVESLPAWTLKQKSDEGTLKEIGSWIETFKRFPKVTKALQEFQKGFCELIDKGVVKNCRRRANTPRLQLEGNAPDYLLLDLSIPSLIIAESLEKALRKKGSPKKSPRKSEPNSEILLKRRFDAIISSARQLPRVIRLMYVNDSPRSSASSDTTQSDSMEFQEEWNLERMTDLSLSASLLNFSQRRSPEERPNGVTDASSCSRQLFGKP